MFKFLLYKFGQFCVRRLSLPAAYRWANFISDLHYYFSFRDRRAVRKNLQAIFPPGDKDLERRVREVFRNFGRYLVEFFRMAGEIDDAFIRDRVDTGDLAIIADVLRKGKGAILLTAHIGNWELGGVILSQLGYPSVAVALPHKERPVNNLFNRQREARGVTIVPTHAATRRCLTMLQQNKIVALVADRAFGPSGVVLDFLGKKAFFPKGPAIFSVKTGAPIIPMFLLRTGVSRFRLIVSKPIDPVEVCGGGKGGEKALKEIMTRYIRVIETIILRYPEQWLMFRDYSVEETMKTIRQFTAEAASR